MGLRHATHQNPGSSYRDLKQTPMFIDLDMGEKWNANFGKYEAIAAQRTIALDKNIRIFIFSFRSQPKQYREWAGVVEQGRGLWCGSSLGVGVGCWC